MFRYSFVKLVFFGLFCLTSYVQAQYTVTGGSGSPLLAEQHMPYNVYLLNGLQGAQISFTSKDPGVHQWRRYKTKVSEAEPVPSQQSGNTSYVTDVKDGYGYFVGETNDPKTQYVWIIDYSLYQPVFNSLTIMEDEFKCKSLTLKVNITAPNLRYYTLNGAPVDLKRTYSLQYQALAWDETGLTFQKKSMNDALTGSLSEIKVDAPLENTDYTLSGDTYAKHFGLEKTMKTPIYQAIAVEAHRTTERSKEKQPNEQTGGITDLGGSAPIEITFTGYANEPVASFYVWQISRRTPTGFEPIVRYTDKVLRYNFDQSGSYRVRLEVSDAHSNCIDSSQVDSVTISESDLKVPNAFSPGSSEGVNDEFKVSYKSLVKFHGWIYSRWGRLLFEWTDPAQGWDGKVAGQYVPTGVYFYIIEAEGSDKVKYSKKGDINILRSKTF